MALAIIACFRSNAFGCHINHYAFSKPVRIPYQTFCGFLAAARGQRPGALSVHASTWLGPVDVSWNCHSVTLDHLSKC
jgi:hypothetical protein